MAITFLALPSEIIYSIIELSRPAGFESIVLTCKRTYRIGEKLIPDHISCKKWGATIASTCTEPVVVLRELLFTPPKWRDWLLLYIMQFTISELDRLQSHECLQILDNLESEAPGLFKQLLGTIDLFPEVEPHLTVYDVERTKAKLGDDHPLFNHPDSEDEWASSNEHKPQAESSLVYGPNPSLYHVLVLLLFSNLKQLEVDSKVLFRGPIDTYTEEEDFYYGFPWFIEQRQGRTFLQRLEEIKWRPATHLSVGGIGSCLLLPNLKALMVDKCWDSGDMPWTKLNDNWPPPGHTFPLECLVFLRAYMTPQLVGELLRPLVSLKTFIWEDAVDVFIRGEDGEDESRESTFQPQGLVEQLELGHRSTLEHLVLTTVTDDGSRIPMDQRVFHFKAFTKLTHLEIDVEILQLQGDFQSDTLTLNVPSSLVDVLPSSIEVVHLVIRRDPTQNIEQMLQELPARKSEFPALHEISIRFVECLTLYETIISTKPLQDELKSVGIQLEMRELPADQVKERIPIIKRHVEHVNGESWFWDDPAFTDSIHTD